MKINFDKGNGLVPAIVQDENTDKILMLGYMNKKAYDLTLETKKVTFYSRSRKTLWTKGETSGNYLNLKQILIDCDQDTFLVKAVPQGPTCHTGADTCFNETNTKNDNFLQTLEQIIQNRKTDPTPESYTASLFAEGINKIAQKVGEEATELIIEAIDNNENNFKNEAADLIYHLLVLITEKGLVLDDIIEVLRTRHK